MMAEDQEIAEQDAGRRVARGKAELALKNAGWASVIAPETDALGVLRFIIYVNYYKARRSSRM